MKLPYSVVESPEGKVSVVDGAGKVVVADLSLDEAGAMVVAVNNYPVAVRHLKELSRKVVPFVAWRANKFLAYVGAYS